MTPRIYAEETRDTKQTNLHLREGDGGTPILCCVDGEGLRVSTLLIFEKEEVIACGSARVCLEDCGYDTSWAQWDENGKLVLS